MNATRLSSRTQLAAIGSVLGGVLFQTLYLGLPAIFVGVGLIVAWLVWATTAWTVTPRLRRLFFLAVPIFAIHGLEEVSTGLQRELPALFGRPPLSDTQFLVFNGTWFVVFALSAWFLRPDRPLPVLIILFFALVGGVGNGVIHLALVLISGGYFPGAWTASLCFIIGALLFRELYSKKPAVPQ